MTMLPQSLGRDAPEILRRAFKVVRADTFQTLPGLILSASVITGDVVMQVPAPDDKTAEQSYAFGARGIIIVGR